MSTKQIGLHHTNPVISKQMKWSSRESKMVMKCYLLSEPMVRSYGKRMLSLWSNKGIFWVAEARLADQTNSICRNNWMNDLQIEEVLMIQVVT